MSSQPQSTLQTVALAQLIATVTLALCTLIVATAVSIGLARADVARPIVSHLAQMDDQRQR